MHRNATEQLRALLRRVPGLGPRECEDLAAAINNMADKACDLDEIFRRLLEKEHGPEELGELLSAFELTTEQLRGDSDTINGRLYDLADRLKELARNGRGSEARP
jgi:hypothetical protein